VSRLQRRLQALATVAKIISLDITCRSDRVAAGKNGTRVCGDQGKRARVKVMTNAVKNLVLLGVLACFSFAPCAFAQVTLQIDAVPSDNVMDDIYVGPYAATNTQTGAGTQIICDDFVDESNSKATTYTVSNFSELGSTMWGSYLMSSGGGDHTLGYVTQLYDEAAWLAIGMFRQTGTEQGYYSYALWAIFAPNQVLAWLSSAKDYAACNAVFGNSCTSTTATVGSLLYTAQNGSTGGNYSNILILDANGCKTPGSCGEQEFFEVVAAEGGGAAMYALLASMCCLVAIFLRNRRAKAAMA
jgi:hypothetical protein